MAVIIKQRRDPDRIGEVQSYTMRKSRHSPASSKGREGNFGSNPFTGGAGLIDPRLTTAVGQSLE